MTSKRIAQSDRQQKSEKSQESGILQRAAVRSDSDAGMQSTDDKQALVLSNSAFSKDFSQVPISTTKPQQFHAINLQSHPMPPIQAKLTIGEPNDRYEQEADRVASEVVQRINAPSSAVQRSPLPRQQLPQHTATETRSASVGDRVIQAKRDMIGNRQDLSVEQRPNKTGLPDVLKSGAEDLSGVSLDNVKVHYNSSRPAQLNALAYAQGSHIHVAPGQEQHLPHEAWHIVQQAQGRVKPTMQMKDGVPVNDDEGLEHEADVMGVKALQTERSNHMRTGSVPHGKAKTTGCLLSASNGQVKSSSPGLDKRGLIQRVFINKTTGNKSVEEIEEVIAQLKILPSTPEKIELQQLGTLEPTDLQIFLRKLAEGPNITYESDKELVEVLNNKGLLLLHKHIRAPKLSGLGQWRKFNRIAGQMEAKLSNLKVPEEIEEIRIPAQKMTNILVEMVSTLNFELGLEVLDQGIKLLNKVKDFLNDNSSKSMWQLYGLMSHLGPLSHFYETFAQIQKESQIVDKVKRQKESILGLLRDIRQLMAKNPDGVTVVAHRGSGPTNRTMGKLISEEDNRRKNRPAENSPEAFDAAFSEATKKVDTPALDGVECDVYLSFDKVPMLSHEGKVREQLINAQKQVQEKLLTSSGINATNDVEVHHLPAETLQKIQRTDKPESKFITLTELLDMVLPVATAYYEQTGKAFRVEVEMKGAKVFDTEKALDGLRPLQDAVAKVVSQFHKKQPHIPVEIVLFNGTPLDVEGYAGLRSKKTALGGLYTGLGVNKENLTKGNFDQKFIDELRYQFSVEFSSNNVETSELTFANTYLNNFITTLVFGQEFAPAGLNLTGVEPSHKIGNNVELNELHIQQQREFHVNIQKALERYAENPQNRDKVKKLHILTDYPKKAEWIKQGLQKATMKALETT